MLSSNQGFASWSVNDIAAAKQFYGQTLGLNLKDQMGGIEVSVGSNIPCFIYSKPDHQAATYTVFNFLVPNIEAEVDELTSKGVIFEKYDQGYMKTDEKGIARGDGENSPTMAWFKDPAGNFLSLIQK